MGPGSPSPDSLSRVPVSTPGGTLTFTFARVETAPVPRQVSHGSGITLPSPPQVGHGLETEKKPWVKRCAPLPLQVRQVWGVVPGFAPDPEQVSHRFRIGNEVVVDEVDGLGSALTQPVQLRDDLLRSLQPRDASIECGDIAELACVGAAARKLDAREEILGELDKLIRRHWEVLKLEALAGREDKLSLGPAVEAIQKCDELVGRVTELADMDEVCVGVQLGGTGGGGSAERHRASAFVRPLYDVIDGGTLHVHA